MPAPKKTTATKAEEKEEVKANEGAEAAEVKGAETEPVSEAEEETVVVSKSDLEGFLKRLNDLEEDNKRLINVADKGRLQQERDKQVAADGAPLVRTVKLTRLDSKQGKIVVAWKVLANESYVDGNRLVEKQDIEVFFKEGGSEKMRLIDFYRRQNKETIAEIIKRSLNERTGDTEVEVEMMDGERLSIGLAFVN